MAYSWAEWGRKSLEENRRRLKEMRKEDRMSHLHREIDKRTYIVKHPGYEKHLDRIREDSLEYRLKSRTALLVTFLVLLALLIVGLNAFLHL